MFPAINEAATMSSREISDLTDKEHSKVVADIKRTLNEAGIDDAEFSGIYTDSMNRKQAIYNLPRRECDLVISGYSVKYRLAIIDRWQELEAKNQVTLPSYPEALRQLASSIELSTKQQAIIEQQKPAVEFVERYVEARSSKCLSDVAKLLKHKPHAFIAKLALDGVLFMRGGSWIPYQKHIDAGRFTVTTGESNGHAFQQTRVEPDGIVWLAKNYPA